jgi:hypothetical protein
LAAAAKLTAIVAMSSQPTKPEMVINIRFSYPNGSTVPGRTSAMLTYL